jgi:hypothetical protein
MTLKKTIKKYLVEKTSKDIDFIADELSNDENSTDAELILHLTKETNISSSKISKIVKKLRSDFLKNIISMDDAIIKIKKFL